MNKQNNKKKSMPHKKNRSFAKGKELNRKPKYTELQRTNKMAKSYFDEYFRSSGPYKSNTVTVKKAVARLKRWEKLSSVAIPDSGADISIMHGDVWLTVDRPGTTQYVDVSGYEKDSSNGIPRKIMDGRSTVLNPDGTPLCVIKLNASAYTPGNGDCLLSQSQMEHHGCKFTQTGFQTISHSRWPIPIHCLPRGNGWFVPLRKPTKKDLEELPLLELTPKNYDVDASLIKQVERLCSDNLPVTTDPNIAAKVVAKLRQIEVTASPKGQKRKAAKLDFAPTGPKREDYATKMKALTFWCKIFGDVPPASMVKTLLANTAEAVELECEHRIIPRGTLKPRFPYLRPKFLSEVCYTDTIEWKSGGKINYGQTFWLKESRYGMFVRMPSGQTYMKSAFAEFVAEVGAPTHFIFDNHQAQISKSVKRYCAKFHIKVRNTEPLKPHQNKDERFNGILKGKADLICNKYDVDPHYYGHLFKFICHLYNHTSLDVLKGRTPIEALTGETGDISHLRFHFWEPIWFMRTGTKFPNPVMIKGIYLGPSENTGDEVTHHILPVSKADVEDWETTDAKKEGKSNAKRRPLVLARSYVCARDPLEKSYRQIITDHRRSFLFPKVLCPSRYDRETIPWNVQVLKDHKDANSENLLVDMQPTKKTKRATTPEIVLGENGLSQPEEAVPAANRQEKPSKVDQLVESVKEFQTELTSAEARAHPDAVSDFKILSHKIINKAVTFKVMLNTTGVIMAMDFGDLKADCPFELRKYIMEKGVGRRNKLKEYTWALAFKKIEHQVKARMRRYYGEHTDIDEIDAPTPLTIRVAMRRAKVAGRRRTPATSHRIMYGVRVPKNVDEAYALDEANGNTYWADSIKKELDALMGKRTLHFPEKGVDEEQLREDIKSESYQFARIWWVFVVKPDRTCKSRIVISGNMVDASGLETFSSHMASDSQRILMALAAHNDYKVGVGDINNAYLLATSKENVYSFGDEAFFRAGYSTSKHAICRVGKAQYGLKTSGYEWFIMLAESLRSMGFKRTRGDPDVWYRPYGKDFYCYIGTHTDDLLVVSKDVDSIFEDLKQLYSFKDTVAPVHHLGVDYVQYKDSNGITRYQLGSFTYVKEAIEKMDRLLVENGFSVPHNSHIPICDKWEPELEDGPLCSDKEHTLFMQLVGIYLWIVALGRVDIGYATSSLSRFSAAPRRNHLTNSFKVLGYLRRNPDKRLAVDSRPMAVMPGKYVGSQDPQAMKELYPDAAEEFDQQFPEPRGEPLQTSIWYDANNAHDKVTRRSVESYIMYVGRTQTSSKVRRQGSIAPSTYISEIASGRTAAEGAMNQRYLIRSFGAVLDGPTHAFGDNEASIKSTTIPGSALKHRHIGISYHIARECEAAGITRRRWVSSPENRSDGGTKALGTTKHTHLYRNGGGIFCVPK
jgi:hypothetical protein